jgi:hypothetical protein
MTTGNKPNVASWAGVQIDADLLQFLDRQKKLIEETTGIDEHLNFVPPENSHKFTKLVERATQVREEADQELHEQLRRYTTQEEPPRFTGMALLAAAFAQCAIGSDGEDKVLTYAVSQMLERFVSQSEVIPVRDRIEDLLNLAHRRAAISREAPLDMRTKCDRPGNNAVEPTDSHEPDDDMFGFPRL